MNARILRTNEVSKLVGMSRSTIWRLERENKFPKRKRISKRLVGWLQSDIVVWMKTK